MITSSMVVIVVFAVVMAVFAVLCVFLYRDADWEQLPEDELGITLPTMTVTEARNIERFIARHQARMEYERERCEQMEREMSEHEHRN